MRTAAPSEHHLGVGDDDLVDVPLTHLRRPAGSVIVRAGTAAVDVHLLRLGNVELVRRHGAREVVVAQVGPGGVIGDVPLLLHRPHALDAVAATDVELLTIAGTDLNRLLAHRPALARRWLVSVAARAAEAHERLDEVLAGHLDLRVASVLLRRAGPDGRVDITQHTLARLLGVQRTSVTDAVARLETRGMIRRGYGRIDVVDPAALHNLLEG